MFCICTENRVDNRDVLFITQQTRLFCLSPHPTNEQTGVHKEHLVGALIGQLTPTDPRHILDQMTSCTAYKTAEIRSKEGYSVMTSVFPSHHYGAQLSWKWLNTCLLMENNEQIPCFAVLNCVACALSIKLSLSEFMSLLTSILLVLFAIPERATERLCQT